MSDCYAIGCKTCRQHLWVITAFARFLKEHRGEAHHLVFDNTQEFIYGYREIDAKTFAVIEDDFFDTFPIAQRREA